MGWDCKVGRWPDDAFPISRKVGRVEMFGINSVGSISLV